MYTVFYIIHLGGVYMYKNRCLYDYGGIIMRDIHLPASAATPKEVTMHHHKPIPEEEMQSLEKLGYNKHEIWKVLILQELVIKK